MLISIAKSIVRVLAVGTLLLWFAPGLRNGLAGWHLSRLALLGGALYGAGAAINGGCAFSTLNQLADGHLRMLLTFVGLAVGALADLALVGGGRMQLPSPTLMLVIELFPWVYGSWSCPSTLRQQAETLVAISASPWPIQWFLFAAMHGGLDLAAQELSSRVAAVVELVEKPGRRPS
jgi:hypothetical protein